MGRIAEALKRAQHERNRRSGQGEVATAKPVSVGQIPEPLEAIFESPLPAKSFVISAEPITPDAIASEVIAFHQPTAAMAEKYRSIRTRLMAGNPAGGTRVYAITSSLPSEGKTVTTANLGFSMAELKHLRVAMVDLDFRGRGLSRLYQVDDRPGIGDVLRGEKGLAEVCIPVTRNNLHLIPVGNLAGMNPSDLLADPRLAVLFKEITDRYHYSLIDTPATDAVADIGLIAPLCHAVVLVIRMNRTPEPALRRCVRRLQANHITIAGSILAGYCDETMASTDTHDYYEGAL